MLSSLLPRVIAALARYLKFIRPSVASGSLWPHSNQPSLRRIPRLALKGGNRFRERLGDLPKATQEERFLRQLGEVGVEGVKASSGLLTVPENQKSKWGEEDLYL
jgi:hypothetical protein